MTVTVEQLAAWLNTPETAELTRLLEVASNHVGSRVIDTTDIRFEQATLMYAARLFKRKASPEGSIAMDGFTTAFPTWDADIEALISPIRAWRFGS